MTITTMASDLRTEPCNAIYPYVLLSKYRLLVHQLCRLAFFTDEVAIHLKTRHRDINLEHRQGLVEKIRQIPNILCNQDELLRDLRCLTDAIKPIPHLSRPEK
jgi:hypothetical protein